MKLFLLSLLFALPTAALAETYPNARFTVNWDKPESLRGSVVLMCDDTYYPAADIAIPGKPGEDFHVELATDITGGYFPNQCKVKVTRKARGAIYTIDSDGACDVIVTKRRRSPTQPIQRAVYSIHDAC